MAIGFVSITLLLASQHSSSWKRAPDDPLRVTSPTAALDLYSVVQWSDVSLGNHRAVLHLTGLVGEGTLAWAHVVWRLPGLAVDGRMLRMQTMSGEAIQLHVLSIDSEAVTLLFEPLSCADGAVDKAGAWQEGGQEARQESCTYLLYYLPYMRTCETGPSSSCSTPYKRSPLDATCAADHGAQVGDRVCCEQPGTLDNPQVKCPRRAPTCVGYIAGSAWGQCIVSGPLVAPDTRWGESALALLHSPHWRERTAQAVLMKLQARTERDSFYPMEVPPTAAELSHFHSSYDRSRALLVWPSDRKLPIRMTHTLPLAWLLTGAAAVNTSVVRGEAERGEFFTFQVCLHMHMHEHRHM